MHLTALRRPLAVLLTAVVAWSMTTAVPAHAAAKRRAKSGAVAASPLQHAPVSRAAWAWFQEDPADLVDLARRQGLRELYVHVRPTVMTDGDLPRLQALARLAEPAGVRLVALGGDPRWTNRPQDALAWQAAATATGLFAATHVDVEPYALPGWSNAKQRKTLVAKYVDLLSRLQQADTRPLEADVPFWFGTIPAASGSGTLADDVLARVDAVTVMSYRDTAAGVLQVGADVLQRADDVQRRTGRVVPVHLATETNPLADCSYCTFAGKGLVALTAALDAVDVAAAATYASYAGIAVHDVKGWTALGA
ncbi:hypothetical protein GCM10027446_07420 [Angustibacter peucedani]